MHFLFAFRRLCRNQTGHRHTGFDYRRFHGCRVRHSAAMRGHRTTAPVSISTAFSALYASAVRPSFSFVISASPSLGLCQSSLEVFFLRLRDAP